MGTVLATTTATQVTEASFATDAWGNPISGSAADNPFVYLGGLGYWQEPTLGLDYVRARWLNPATGTWLSVDPVPTEPRYSYAHNSPSFRVDPSGTDVNFWESFQQVGGVLQDDARQIGNQIITATGKALVQFTPLINKFTDKYWADYQRWYGAQKPIVRAFCPPISQGRLYAALWFADLSIGAAEGFLDEARGMLKGAWDAAVSPFTSAYNNVEQLLKFSQNPLGYIDNVVKEGKKAYEGVQNFINFLARESVYFEIYGFTINTFFVRYINDPLVRAVVELASLESLPPKALGKLIGWVMFQIMVQVVIQCVALLTGGAGELLELAEAGELGVTGVRGADFTRKALNALDEVRKIQAAVRAIPNKAISKAVIAVYGTAKNHPKAGTFVKDLAKEFGHTKSNLKTLLSRSKNRYHQLTNETRKLKGKTKRSSLNPIRHALKITVKNENNISDHYPHFIRDFQHALANNQTAITMLESLNKRGVTIRIDYDMLPDIDGKKIAGEARAKGAEIILYRRHNDNSTPEKMMYTLIHEGFHIRHATTTKSGKPRKDFRYTQEEESRVRVLEEFVKTGERPSKEQKREILLEVKTLYGDLPEK